MAAPDMNPDRYPEQLAEKTKIIHGLFESFEMPELEVYESPPRYFRMRAEFRVWHDKGDMYYVMFDRETKERYRLEQFPAAGKMINELMPVVIKKSKANPILSRKLFRVDYLSTLSGEMLITLIYHRKLNEEWSQAAVILKQELRELGYSVDLIGRSRKIKIVEKRDFVVEELMVNERAYTYQQIENSFTQPNARVAEKMLCWAVDCTKESHGDLLELYCGNGNFSLPLSQNFNRVLATEVAKPSVASAQYNILENKIDNVKVVRLSANEVGAALSGTETFRRLNNAGVDLGDYEFSTVFVDPPRAGLDEQTVELVQQFDRILYVSCNPETLKANLDLLSQTHDVMRFALFDQFPYTPHIESGVFLVRKEP